MSAVPEWTSGDLLTVGVVAWPRPAGDVFAELDRVVDRVSSVTGDRAEQPMNQEELGLLGAWAAAVWTVGQAQKAPMSRTVRPLTWDTVERESATALSISSVQLSGWEYATGVNRWMQWLLGAVPELWLPGDPRPQGWPEQFR